MLIGSSPAVEDALALYDRGLAVIPVLKDDGKSPAGIIANFGKWRCRLPRDKTPELFRKYPGANIAILPHLCRPRLVVIDCDDDAALAAGLHRYGPTTLRVQTPRGAGGHLYYRAPDTHVGQCTLRQSDGLAIEIKAGPGAVVIVPPSRRLS